MTKQTTRPRMEHKWICKIIRKKAIKKIVKIRVKLPHMNKKITIEKAIFAQTPFSLYFKNRVKNAHRKTTRKRR